MQTQATPGHTTDSDRWGSLIPLDGYVSPSLERQLGYFGNERFCFFYFDQQGDGLIWHDGSSYGFGLGSWRVFSDHIEPVALSHGVRLAGRRGDGHVLLIDREHRSACFADWRTALAMIQEQQIQQSQDQVPQLTADAA